jgi:hypothetical protein
MRLRRIVLLAVLTGSLIGIPAAAGAAAGAAEAAGAAVISTR